jgi:hypothetical protein
MLDERWERDTLFMVFEEDFRFFAEDAEREPPPGPALLAGDGPPETRYSDRARRVSSVGQWWEVPRRPEAAAFDNVPEVVSDLVRIATAAKRAGRGELIWCGWQPGDHTWNSKKPEVRRVGTGRREHFRGTHQRPVSPPPRTWARPKRPRWDLPHSETP